METTDPDLQFALEHPLRETARENIAYAKCSLAIEKNWIPKVFSKAGFSLFGSLRAGPNMVIHSFLIQSKSVSLLQL
jgi:hypothetical protein